MKKSLLVISVILLIAGLFISCNSEAAGSADNLATVKFADDSKALNTTTEGPVLPILDNLYWYYQATKTSVGGNSGQTTGWTRVNDTTTGLAGQIGPFSLGNWTFELAAVATETEPTNDNKVYWGNADAMLSRGSNTVIVDLHTHVSSGSTVKLDDVLLLEIDVADEDVTWYWSAFLDDTSTPAITGEIVMSPAGAKKTGSDKTVASNVSSGDHSITITVFDSNDESANAVFSASKDFIAFPGATIIVSGNLEELTADVEFEPGSIIPDTDVYEAYVLTNSNYRYYETLEAAIAAAAAGDTVGLLKNVSLSGCQHDDNTAILAIDKSLIIDGKGHTLNLTNTAEDRKNRKTGLAFVDSTYYTATNPTSYDDGDITDKMTWEIKDLIINGHDMLRVILVDAYSTGNNPEGKDRMTLSNVTINSDCECLYGNGDCEVVATNCVFNTNNEGGNNWGNDQHPVYICSVLTGYSCDVSLNNCTVNSNANCFGVFPSGGATVSTNNCTITSTYDGDLYAAIYITNDDYDSSPVKDAEVKIESGTVNGNVILRGKNKTSDTTLHCYFAINNTEATLNGNINEYDYNESHQAQFNLWKSLTVESGYTWYTVRPVSVATLENYEIVE